MKPGPVGSRVFQDGNGNERKDTMISRFSRRIRTHLAALVMGGMALCGVGTFDAGCSGSLDDIWGYVNADIGSGWDDGCEYDDGCDYDDGNWCEDEETHGFSLEQYPPDQYPLE
jgi:hypothetical protein